MKATLHYGGFHTQKIMKSNDENNVKAKKN